MHSLADRAAAEGGASRCASAGIARIAPRTAAVSCGTHPLLQPLPLDWWREALRSAPVQTHRAERQETPECSPNILGEATPVILNV